MKTSKNNYRKLALGDQRGDIEFDKAVAFPGWDHQAVAADQQ